MANGPEKGPEVPANENLLRGIFVPQWWSADTNHLSSAIFAFAKFSAFIESMADAAALLSRMPTGSGMIMFNCGVARTLQFDARHEPEQGEQSHSNIYCDLNSNQ